MKPTPTLVLAIAIALLVVIIPAAAASVANTTDFSYEDVAWNYQVVGPGVADADDRNLLRSATECISIRFKGDGNAKQQNSLVLEDLTEGNTLYQKNQGDLSSNTTIDSDCFTAPEGNLLKLTVLDTQGGYESGYFHALFVGPRLWRKIEGSAMGKEDTSCFKLMSADPYVEDASCDAVAVRSTSPPTPSLPSPITPPLSSRSMGCGSGMKKVKIVFEGDQYRENKWAVVSRNSGATVWQSKNYKLCSSSNWQSCNRETAERCLPTGDYDFHFWDEAGDGCPKLQIYMESTYGWGYDKIYGLCKFGKQWSQHFHTRTVQLSSRDRAWLTAHNIRRAKYWFEKGVLKKGTNPYYVPMRWDPALANKARVYAEQLLDDCNSNDMHHDPTRGGAGENLAKNRGLASSSYGQQPPADNILNRFVEMEFDDAYGARYHMTQSLWKASMYLGCGDAMKSYTVNGNKHQCHTQVCRYTAPGNCGISGNAGSENFDLIRIMAEPEKQNCGDRWPPSGLYAA